MPSRDDIEARLSFLNLEPADLELLGDLEPVLEKHADGLVSAFYRHLLSFEATRALLREPAVKQRLLLEQRRYLLSLTQATIDVDYVAGRRRIGEVHERIKLGPRWYLGAYSLYFSLLTPIICELNHTDLERGARTLMALQKRLSFDAQLAMESYIERHEQELAFLNRELAREGRQLGRDLEDRSAELRRTRERARAAEELASIATLTAGLAHEVGTPMGVIQGHAKMLESSVRDEAGRWRLRTIQEQIARISKIIQSLLNMTRPRRGEPQSVDLSGVLETTLSFVEEKLARQKIEVERSFAPSARVTGDPERLQQLFLNLFLNAADAMAHGGRLRVEIEPETEGLVVRVSDTGAGISAEELPRIFEPFYTSKEAGQGNGLGLVVAQQIVADHGGTIDVESGPGEGTEFRIVFPASR